MAAKPLTTEEIALTEKKMDMTLDEIIKMSKNKTPKAKKQRVPNKAQKPLNGMNRDKTVMVRQYMDSRSSLRQGALAQRRSNFQANQFPLAAQVARKAVNAPVGNRVFNNNSRTRGGNRSRFGVVASRRPVNNGFAVKAQPQRQQQRNFAAAKQRPQTLDSLFANMTEQRMRFNQNSGRRGGGRNAKPFGRGRHGN